MQKTTQQARNIQFLIIAKIFLLIIKGIHFYLRRFQKTFLKFLLKIIKGM